MPMTPEANATSEAKAPNGRTSRQRAYDAKRARGEISCAECRRLKIKCDKNIPCKTCVRRGCANICPNGSLSGGQGTRLILADTETLHRKITQLSERVRQLEDALAILQAAASHEKHPLLRKDLLKIKHWPEVNDNDNSRNAEQVPPEQAEVADVIRDLGTLSIGEDGEAKYFGQSAGPESLLHSYDHEFTSDTTAPPGIGDTSSLLTTFDNFNSDNQQALRFLELSLPPITRAWSLCETYYEHCALYFRPVKREEFIKYFMTPLYSALRENEEPGSVVKTMPHKIAVVYLLFASGALMDLTEQPYNSEAWRYAALGKNALMMRSIKESPAIETVQAMGLLAHFFGQSGRRHTVEFTWSIMSNCLRLAQSIGLHRDCARWGLEASHIQRRRYVFWEMYRSDVLASLYVGRPPTIAAAFIDCEFPTDEEQTLDNEGKIEPGFWQWKYHVVKDLLAPILEDIAAVRPSSYASVLEFDRKARQLAVPSSFCFVPSPDHESYATPSVWMRACLTMQLRLTPLLYIHRPWFTQALMDPSGDPMRSRYAPSYLAAYRCALLIIKSHVQYFNQCPAIFLRLGSFWSNLFSSTVIMGLLVTKVPFASMASNALALLDIAVDIFEKGYMINSRAQRAITFLRKFKEEAHKAHTDANANTRSPATLFDKSSPSDGPDELALFGGQTKLLNNKLLTKYWANGVRLKHYIAPPDFVPLSKTFGTPAAISPTNMEENAPTDMSGYLGGPSPASVSEAAAVNDSLSFWNGESFPSQFLEFPQDTSFLHNTPPSAGDTPQSSLDMFPGVTGYMGIQSDGTYDPSPQSLQNDFGLDSVSAIATDFEMAHGQPEQYLDMDQPWLDLMRGAGLLDNNLFDIQQDSGQV